MGAQLAVTFTGLRFENPFLLASAPPTESDSNIMRAFDAGWGGVVTKTIGLHPVVNVAGPKTKFLRATPDSAAAVDAEAARAPRCTRPGTGSSSPTSRSTGGFRSIARIKQAFPDRDPGRVDHGRLGQRRRAGALADAGQGVPGRGRRRARAEPLLPAHGPQGHGLEHRQGHRSRSRSSRKSSRKSRACRSGPS